MNNLDILDQFDKWNSALQSRDAQQVVDLYAEDATLLPTVSNRVRHNHDEIRDYFDRFLTRQPLGKIVESNVKVLDELAINSGVYEFSFADGSSVLARYTFVYKKADSQWLILEHHSSAMPEAA